MLELEWMNKQKKEWILHGKNGGRGETLYKSSVESQKGIIAVQRCSIENQKGAITI